MLYGNLDSENLQVKIAQEKTSDFDSLSALLQIRHLA